MHMPTTGTASVAVVGEPTAVAVKIFERRAYRDEAEVARLRRELEFASELVHPRLVATHGTTLLFERFSEPCLVMELMPGGSLYELLHGSTQRPKTPTGENEPPAPTAATAGWYSPPSPPLRTCPASRGSRRWRWRAR